AERAAVARGIAADAAGILLGDVEARRAVEDPRLELGERVGQLADFLGRSLEEKEREPLGRLRPDAGQPLERVDQPRHPLRVIGHELGPRAQSPSPGILSPAESLPSSACIISLDLRSASLHAASTRSSSICASSGLMTSRSILIAVSSCLPLASTVTMPPPAVASTFFFPISSCMASICCCSFCASFIMLPKPFTGLLLPADAAGPRPPRPG